MRAIRRAIVAGVALLCASACFAPGVGAAPTGRNAVLTSQVTWDFSFVIVEPRCTGGPFAIAPQICEGGKWRNLNENGLWPFASFPVPNQTDATVGSTPIPDGDIRLEFFAPLAKIEGTFHILRDNRQGLLIGAYTVTSATRPCARLFARNPFIIFVDASSSGSAEFHIEGEFVADYSC
jgi:hypothetical protein